MRTIQNLAIHDRPREKILAKGVGALTDVELLMAIIGAGGPTSDVLTLARGVLNLLDRNKGRLEQEDLIHLHGMGLAQSARLLAAQELFRRRLRPTGLQIKCASDVLPLVRHLSNKKQEHLITLTLNGAHELIEQRIISIGLLNSTLIHPREVFASAIEDRAASIIIAHNHPSGNLLPSKADEEVTNQLKNAGKLLGISLLDHIIFNENDFFSFAENGNI